VSVRGRFELNRKEKDVLGELARSCRNCSAKLDERHSQHRLQFWLLWSPPDEETGDRRVKEECLIMATSCWLKLLGSRILKRDHLLGRSVVVSTFCVAAAAPGFAQSGASPWTQAVQALQTAFTGPIATGLALVAIVVGGLMFAFGEGAAKRTLAGVIFGVGMAVGAVNFMSWLFG
jgi:type IV secretion system protein TrbC